MIADCLGGVDPTEILFTSCATESNNSAIVGTVRATPTRRHILTTAVEHPAVAPAENLVGAVAERLRAWEGRTLGATTSTIAMRVFQPPV